MRYMTKHNAALDNSLDFDPNADYKQEVIEAGGADVQEQMSAESALDAQVVMNQVAETVGTGEPSPQDAEVIAELTSNLKSEMQPANLDPERAKNPQDKWKEEDKQRSTVIAELSAADSEFQEIKRNENTWRDGYKNLGSRLVAGAKGLEIVGVGGGVAAASLGAFTALTEGGALLTNPVTFGAVMVGASSVVIGEAIKLYQRYKERKYGRQLDEKRKAYSQEAARRVQKQ